MKAIAKGVIGAPSQYYRGRTACAFYGRLGPPILEWLREVYPDDDMLWATEYVPGKNHLLEATALLTDEQLTLLQLRWADNGQSNS